MINSSVKEAWQINTKINRKVFEHITPEMINVRTPGGGFTVAEHILEILNTPKYFGIKFDANRLEKIPNLYEVKGEDYIAETDLTRIREVAKQTANLVLEAVESAEGKGDLPHTNLDIYLIHMMAHDAHHRGQILLALKTASYPLPNEGMLWGVWRTV